MIGRRVIERTPADRWIFGCTLAFLFWLPLPWASHRPWSSELLIAIASLLLGARLLLTAAGRVTSAKGLSRQLLLPTLWWTLWLGWIAFQLFPLDSHTLTVLSPESGALHEHASDLLGRATWRSTSIAPAATIDAWRLTAGYACLYVLVLVSCHDDRDRMRLVLGTVVAAGLFQAIYGSLMTLSGLEWGFLQPKQHYLGVATGTFVNRNHLAGYLQLASAAALGLILSDLGGRGSARTLKQWLSDVIALALSAKMRARVALVVMAIALVLTRSRMGNIAFFASLCVCGMGFILLRRRGYTVHALVLFASVIALDVLVVSRWYGLERVVERIEATDIASEERTFFLEDAPPAIDAYLITGSGLGTFAYAFAPFRTANMNKYFDHAHNDYIEFLIETGAIGIVLLAVFVLAHTMHALRVLVVRRRRMAAAVGFAALMALMAQAIHATADFNLQIPANAATLLVLMALSAACPSTSGVSWARRRRGADGLDSDSAE